MNAIELVYQPTVHVVASSKINVKALTTLEENMGLSREDVRLPDFTAPRSSLSQIIDNFTFNKQKDIDLLSEFSGRVCYDSYDKGRVHEDYIDNILEHRHGNVLEHSDIVFYIAGISRALSHELVRHSVGASVSQESQRFVASKLLDETKPARFIVPPLCEEMDEHHLKHIAETQLRTFRDFHRVLSTTKSDYSKKEINEAARAVLPNWIETKLVFKTNIRALRNILEQRGSIHADKEIRRLAYFMFKEACQFTKTCLNDIEVNDDDYTLSVRHSKV